MEILQVVIIGIVGTILSISLKKESPQFSLFIGLITGILIFLFAAEYLKRVIQILSELAGSAGVNSGYMDIVLKIIGISYVARFGTELCKDAGEGAIASKVDLAGKIFIAVTGAPVILALMEMIQHFI
ncbi:MAG: stage III sporulation protein AD [Anaerotignaceae bacterium]